MKVRILQIVPAPPGLVLCFGEKQNDGKMEKWNHPVVLFALCEIEDENGNTRQEIAPVDVAGDEISDVSWFFDEEMREGYLGICPIEEA